MLQAGFLMHILMLASLRGTQDTAVHTAPILNPHCWSKTFTKINEVDGVNYTVAFVFGLEDQQIIRFCSIYVSLFWNRTCIKSVRHVLNDQAGSDDLRRDLFTNPS